MFELSQGRRGSEGFSSFESGDLLSDVFSPDERKERIESEKTSSEQQSALGVQLSAGPNLTSTTAVPKAGEALFPSPLELHVPEKREEGLSHCQKMGIEGHTESETPVERQAKAGQSTTEHILAGERGKRPAGNEVQEKSDRQVSSALSGLHPSSGSKAPRPSSPFPQDGTSAQQILFPVPPSLMARAGEQRAAVAEAKHERERAQAGKQTEREVEVEEAAAKKELEIGKEGKPCVLIVDDEKMCLALVAKTMKRQGYRTQVAENGKIALEVLEKQKPNIAFIVMDCQVIGVLPLFSFFRFLSSSRMGSP